MSLLAEILAAVGTDEACTAGDENSNENDLLLVVVGSLFVSGFEAHDAKLRAPGLDPVKMNGSCPCCWQ